MTTAEAYRVLELTAPASADEVKRAYRRKALDSHPDRYQDEAQKAFHAKRFLQIREAYSQLRSESVLELPEESVVVPEFRDNLAGRSFAPRETEDIGNAEKLGLHLPFKVESIVLWCVGLPAAVAALAYFLRLLFQGIQGRTP